MQQNFWEQGNLMKVNFREHLNLFLGNKGKTPIFSREQGNMYPPWEALITLTEVNTSDVETRKNVHEQNFDDEVKNNKQIVVNLPLVFNSLILFLFFMMLDT